MRFSMPAPPGGHAENPTVYNNKEQFIGKPEHVNRLVDTTGRCI